MIHIRKSQDRGRSQIGWLDSFHTFSFSSYQDPDYMGFGNLRVINEDTVQPSFGFSKHSHRDMEIISYVIGGTLEHKDSMGNGTAILPDEIQMMTAGTGIEHSEFNRSKSESLHFLQIWIIPEKNNLKPGYQQKTINKISNEFILLGSREGSDSAITIHQDVLLYNAYLTQDHIIEHKLNSNRMGWLQLVKGKVKLNGQDLSPGDGAAIRDEDITIQCIDEAELLFFDLAAS